MGSTDRTRSAAQPRSATEREWEIFLRPGASDPVRHVGSVTAPTADVAREQADDLFEAGRDLWLCPAQELHRYSTDPLADRDADPSGERS